MDPIAHFFANRHWFEGSAWKYGRPALARGFVHLSQAGPKVTRCDIGGVLVLTHVLQDCNESCVRGGASCVQLQFDWPDQVQIMSERRGSPVQEWGWVSLARTWAIETGTKV